MNGTETEELSGSAVLTNGRNLIEVKVTAEDGVTVERYRFTISRQGENNALLESLQVNGQAIELTEGVYEYSLPLATGTTTAQVAATAQSTRASVSIVNGTKVTSAVQTVQSDVTVGPGTNEITIRVTPETSAGPVYYKLKLKVPNASNARLEALSLGENVSLAEKFDADTFNYTASATESGVTISAIAEEADATVEVIWKDTVIQTGTGSAATELGLTEGDNTVKVRVTSADGSTEKIYTVTVHASGETWLSDLDWESQTSGDSGNPTRKDKSCGNNTLTLWDGSAEETFAKGIGSHADSTIIYDLTGKGYTSFSSYYGVDRETKVNPSQASITFKVYVDGNLKFTSAEMGTNTAKGFTGDIDITGATELKLVMEKGTNNWSDHGDWANAKLTRPFAAQQPVTVTVQANDPAMGSAAADQNEYQKYDTATVTATANAGYRFIGWKLKDSDKIISTDVKYTFTIEQNVELVGIFDYEVSLRVEAPVNGKELKAAEKEFETEFYTIESSWTKDGKTVTTAKDEKNQTDNYQIKVTVTPADGVTFTEEDVPSSIKVNIDGSTSETAVKTVPVTAAELKNNGTITVTYKFEDAFVGGSLRMDYGTDASKTSMRFGYDFELPEGATFAGCEWYYGTKANALAYSLTPTETKYITNPEGKGSNVYRSNIVFTNIGKGNYDSHIYARVLVKYTLDGKSYSKLGSFADTRSVKEIATAIKKSSKATDKERTYAESILGQLTAQ